MSAPAAPPAGHEHVRRTRLQHAFAELRSLVEPVLDAHSERLAEARSAHRRASAAHLRRIEIADPRWEEVTTFLDGAHEGAAIAELLTTDWLAGGCRAAWALTSGRVVGVSLAELTLDRDLVLVATAIDDEDASAPVGYTACVQARLRWGLELGATRVSVAEAPRSATAAALRAAGLRAAPGSSTWERGR